MKTTTMKKVNKFRLNAIKAALAVTTAMMLAILCLTKLTRILMA